MHKILVFDLDGTLCPIGKGMSDVARRLLRELERAGYRIAVSSGKTLYYLAGFMRQLDLEAPILIGENGGAFQEGVGIPPHNYHVFPYDPKADEQIALMRKRINAACREKIWYQPNEVGLVPVTVDPESHRTILKLIEEHKADLDALTIYHYTDSFDMMPNGIDKQNGLRFLSDIMDLKPEDFIVFGDGINDIPMFSYADVSVVIGDLDYPATWRFANIEEAMRFLLEHRF